MITLKPTMYQYYCKKLTKNMVKDLFRRVKAEFESPGSAASPLHNLDKVSAFSPKDLRERLRVVD